MINPSMLFKEFPVIKIEDYTLREIELKDCKDIYEIYSDAEVMQYQGEGPMKAIEDAAGMIELVKGGYKNKHFIKWCIIEETTQKLIGLISFHHIDFRNNNGQLGYILNKAYWSKGIMRSLVRYITGYLFNSCGLRRLEVSIHPDNHPSKRLAENLGFVKEGIKADCVYNRYTEKYEDRIVMGWVKQD